MLTWLKNFGRFIAGRPGNGNDFWYGPLMPPVAANVQVTEDTTSELHTAWACTNRLSSDVAGMPLRVLRREIRSDGREISEFDFSHPVNRLLRQPNPLITRTVFRSLGVNRQLNWGNFYAEIERQRDGRPIALHPIHPSRVKPRHEGELYYEVRLDDGSRVELMPEDMFHVKGRWLKSEYEGKGVITAGRESIGFGLATEYHGAAYFGNGGRPSGALRHPSRIKDKKMREQLREEWQSVHGGPRQAGKVALLQEGMEFQAISWSNEDSQFLETRTLNSVVICQWYDVSPVMVGILDRATFSNIEQQSINHVNYSLMPLANNWEDEIESKLLMPSERDEYYARHNPRSLLRGDFENQSKFYGSMIDRGIYSPNEVREELDMNPVTGGDVHWRALNMAPLTDTETRTTSRVNGNGTAATFNHGVYDVTIPTR